MEVVFTAIFVLVILQASKTKLYSGSALIAIPLTLLAIHIAAIPFSGSSVNPARTFGPAIVGNEWHGIWIYLFAPPLGAVVGWLVHTVVVKGDTHLRDDLEEVEDEILVGSVTDP
jgi:glycerol uptake facilitator-like aquaporin